MPDLTFELLGGETNCAGGKCPAIYKGSDGNIYVKGIIVSKEVNEKLGAESHEDVVQIPLEILRRAM